jgi:hypothetical protein
MTWTNRMHLHRVEQQTGGEMDRRLFKSHDRGPHDGGGVAHAKDTRVEVMVRECIGGNRRQLVAAGQLHGDPVLMSETPIADASAMTVSIRNLDGREWLQTGRPLLCECTPISTQHSGACAPVRFGTRPADPEIRQAMRDAKSG